jgi:nucleoside permease NupC
MSSEEFVKLYKSQDSDESITAFQNEMGFSLIRFYPKDTPYFKDGRRMFIKIATLDRGFFYSVEMTRPEKEGEKTSYIITEGEEYKRKVTNFFSDGSEFIFDNTTQKVNHQPSGKSFTMNEFVEILVANHLSDRLFFKRILNELANGVLKFLFWLSDSRYERIQTAIDKYHYGKGENPPPKDEKKNIEPFFKYFYISKNILFAILLVTFPSAIFFGYLWAYGDFSLSNPSLLLLFFLILFSCEKFSTWLDKKIKAFLMPSKDHFTQKKINFIEKLHDYQYNNKFNLKLNIRNRKRATNTEENKK